MMRNIQVIDGAVNCVYDIFQATPSEFAILFPESTDIAFIEDLSTSDEAKLALEALWKRRIPKQDANGIHGTLFFELSQKRDFYPTFRDAEAINPDGTPLR